MEFINKDTIKLDKYMNEIDKFVFRFIDVLKKHTDYVIISGYVSILLGRARSTEDIDVFIEELTKEGLNRLYQDLKDSGYWCLNAEGTDEVYKYLNNGLAVRFAKNGETIPNFEIKFANKRLSKEALKDKLKAVTSLGEINISSLERQIAFKRYYLKSNKDLEDAKHIEEIFKNKIDYNKIKYYKSLIENEKT